MEEKMAFYQKYQLKNGQIKWLVMYRDSLGKQYKKKGFRTKKEAQLFAANIKVERARGREIDHNMTYREVYEKFFISPYTASREESTVVRFTRDFRCYILPALGDRPIKKITTAECQAAVMEWSKHRKNVAKLGQQAAMIFREALAQHLIFENPMANGLIKYPRVKPNHRPKSFTKSEFQIFIKALKSDYQTKLPRAFAFLWLLAFTGCRKSEVAALKWQDINLDDGYIYIHHSVTRNLQNGLKIGKTKTSSSVRHIPIDKQTVKVLSEWYTHQKQEMEILGLDFKNKKQLLFTNINGGLLTPSKPGKWMHQLEKDHNLPYVTPHGLRHTYGTLLLEAGTPITDVSKLLGHSNVATTMQVYIDLHPVTSHQAANTLAALAND